ncbi:MAG TPA: hypothetical protein VIG99_19450 [Myxococcaceae bacterium]|jgi:nitroreductase
MALDLASVDRALAQARWSPSAHNTQPWLVEYTGDGRIEVRADPARALPHSDPFQRDLRLSLGAFVEALQIALAAEGERFEREPDTRRRTGAGHGALAAEGEHFEREPASPPGSPYAVLTHRGPEAKPDLEAASLLRQRQTSRLPYSPRPIEPSALESLAEAARRHGLKLHLAPAGTPERERWSKWLFAASRESWLDMRATTELRRWVRFDPEGMRAPEDGLSTHCLGLSTAEAAALVLAMRPGPWRAAAKVFAAPALAEQLAKSEVAAAEQAPCFGVLSCAADRGDAGEHGGPLLRVWLEATRLRLAIHPLSVLLDRRGWELAKSLQVSPRQLVLAFRLGRSVPPPRSGRRGVESFAKRIG